MQSLLLRRGGNEQGELARRVSLFGSLNSVTAFLLIMYLVIVYTTYCVAILLFKCCSERHFFGWWICVVNIGRQGCVGEVAFWLRAILLADIENHLFVISRGFCFSNAACALRLWKL